MPNRRNQANRKANRALAIASSLRSSMERKFSVTGFSASAVKEGTLTTINEVPQDLTDTGRIGDRINVVKLSLHAWRVIPGAATGRFSVRFLVILDKQNTLTAANEIFVQNDSAYSPLLQFVKDYRRQFSVLYDSGANHMDQYNKGSVSSWSRKVSIPTKFRAGTEDILTGAIKLVVLSNTASTASQKPLLIGTIRVDYTDN